MMVICAKDVPSILSQSIYRDWNAVVPWKTNQTNKKHIISRLLIATYTNTHTNQLDFYSQFFLKQPNDSNKRLFFPLSLQSHRSFSYELINKRKRKRNRNGQCHSLCIYRCDMCVYMYTTIEKESFASYFLLVLLFSRRTFTLLVDYSRKNSTSFDWIRFSAYKASSKLLSTNYSLCLCYWGTRMHRYFYYQNKHTVKAIFSFFWSYYNYNCCSYVWWLYWCYEAVNIYI